MINLTLIVAYVRAGGHSLWRQWSSRQDCFWTAFAFWETERVLMDFELGGGSDRPVGLFGTGIYGPASLPWGDPEKNEGSNVGDISHSLVWSFVSFMFGWLRWPQENSQMNLTPCVWSSSLGRGTTGGKPRWNIWYLFSDEFSETWVVVVPGQGQWGVDFQHICLL